MYMLIYIYLKSKTVMIGSEGSVEDQVVELSENAKRVEHETRPISTLNAHNPILFFFALLNPHTTPISIAATNYISISAALRSNRRRPGR